MPVENPSLSFCYIIPSLCSLPFNHQTFLLWELSNVYEDWGNNTVNNQTLITVSLWPICVIYIPTPSHPCSFIAHFSLVFYLCYSRYVLKCFLWTIDWWTFNRLSYGEIPRSCQLNRAQPCFLYASIENILSHNPLMQNSDHRHQACH